MMSVLGAARDSTMVKRNFNCMISIVMCVVSSATSTSAMTVRRLRVSVVTASMTFTLVGAVIAVTAVISPPDGKKRPSITIQKLNFRWPVDTVKSAATRVMAGVLRMTRRAKRALHVIRTMTRTGDATENAATSVTNPWAGEI